MIKEIRKIIEQNYPNYEADKIINFFETYDLDSVFDNEMQKLRNNIEYLKELNERNL